MERFALILFALVFVHQNLMTRRVLKDHQKHIEKLEQED
jgi:hypothetical protein